MAVHYAAALDGGGQDDGPPPSRPHRLPTVGRKRPRSPAAVAKDGRGQLRETGGVAIARVSSLFVACLLLDEGEEQEEEKLLGFSVQGSLLFLFAMHPCHRLRPP